MRNTCLLPGKSSVKEMVNSIDDGYYLVQSNNGEASLNTDFTFSIVLGFEIKNGKIGRAIRDTSVSGSAIEVLRSVSKISDDMEWTFGMCGKIQNITVAHGSPTFQCKINVGGES
jgi:TldD protein